MWKKIIAYFAERHFLTNLLVIAVFIGGIFSWQYTNKEELPDVTFDRVHVSVRYAGATADDVEYFVTKPLEEVIRGIDGVYRITSSSSQGSCSINVEIEKNYPDIEAVVTEIRNEVQDVRLPDDIIDDPSIRLFKTSKKAIIDIALMHSQAHLLTLEQRQELQMFARTLEDQLLNLPAVNSVNMSGYRQEELQIRVKPEMLIDFEIPFSTIRNEVSNNNIRKPAGNIEAGLEPKVTLLSELNTVEKLNNLIIQGGFEGGVIKLDQIAEVREGFEKTQGLHKINGHEAILLNVVKSSSMGILDALDAVREVVAKFEKNNLSGTSIQVHFLDDESIDIRNRLSLISVNGAIGFLLILVILFLFLNKRSGLWVAMGIPFTLCFTMIIASWCGFTINGTTLAAVIIVLGIIVDDAIVVAENISRQMQQGVDEHTAAIEGTNYVLLPIIASIVTTCVAFVPLYFFQGRFGAFIKFIPPIIFIMLGASFLESILILPGHMTLNLLRNKKKERSKTLEGKAHWFEKVENMYAVLLKKILPKYVYVFILFICLLIGALFIVKSTMKFVMFPDEETREIVLNGTVGSQLKKRETAEMSKKIEEIIVPYIGKEVVGVITEIAQSRRGSAVEENKFRMMIEIVPKEKRKKSADTLIKEIESKIKNFEGFEQLQFQKSRWGQSSGKIIEIVVQQNNDEKREQVVEALMKALTDDAMFTNIEVDEGMRVPEYRITIKQEKVKRLGISPTDIAATLRGALEGTVLYEFSKDDQDIDVRLTTVDEAKDNIKKVLSLPVENKGNYLVPLGDVVNVEEYNAPNSIFRQDLKRTTLVYADPTHESRLTPLDAASRIEKEIFPAILSQYPTTTLSFSGEVLDTFEARKDLLKAVYLALFLIFLILAILFNSVTKPLIIMLAIPFGLVGIILTFWIHGKVLFGFYAAIGALGLAGVVINDSIIMLVKLDKDFNNSLGKETCYDQIAEIAKTRLRAVVLTTLTTVVGVLPTAYGFAGYDSMLAEMMLALAWGLLFGTLITLVLIPCVYSFEKRMEYLLWWRRSK